MTEYFLNKEDKKQVDNFRTIIKFRRGMNKYYQDGLFCFMLEICLFQKINFSKKLLKEIKVFNEDVGKKYKNIEKILLK
jgi:hypothetical protein